MRSVWLAIVLSAALGLGAWPGGQIANAASAKASGCAYEGPENCHYLQTTGGKVYQLAPDFPLPMPPSNRIVAVQGVITPKHFGFCTAPYIFHASAITLTDHSCRAGRRRK